MKKFIACLLCLIFTACTNTANTEKVTETAIYSDDTKNPAKTFAKALYAELKNTEGEYPFSPISCEHVIPESGFDPEAFEADIFFLDTNSDGSPELFAGGHGTAGLGRYSVFSSCGKKLGNEIFCCFPDMYCITDNVMYAPSNTNWRTGWVKFCEGLPNVCINYVYDDADSEVKIENAEMEINGEKQVLDNPPP